RVGHRSLRAPRRERLRLLSADCRCRNPVGRERTPRHGPPEPPPGSAGSPVGAAMGHRKSGLPRPVARPLDACGHADRGGGDFVIGSILRSTDRVLMDRRSRSRRLVVLAWVTAVVALHLAATPPAAPIPPLNQKVLEFARERIGEKVADGQCLSLAVEALRYAGAKRYPFDPGGDYVWGRPGASFKEALPGDIL